MISNFVLYSGNNYWLEDYITVDDIRLSLGICGKYIWLEGYIAIDDIRLSPELCG